MRINLQLFVWILVYSGVRQRCRYSVYKVLEFPLHKGEQDFLECFWHLMDKMNQSGEERICYFDNRALRSFGREPDFCWKECFPADIWKAAENLTGNFYQQNKYFQVF